MSEMDGKFQHVRECNMTFWGNTTGLRHGIGGSDGGDVVILDSLHMFDHNKPRNHHSQCGGIARIESNRFGIQKIGCS